MKQKNPVIIILVIILDSPWQPEELIEYEEEFVITSLKNVSRSSDTRLREIATRSDSDSRDELARRTKATALVYI